MSPGGRTEAADPSGLHPEPAGLRGLPDGWRIELDDSVVALDGGRVLLGGRPGRLLALTEAGRQALDSIRVGRSASPDRAARLLARRLVDAGMAHPRPPAEGGPVPSVTVVVPVRDRPADLDRCLGSLDGAFDVLVVDDGSADPAAVAAVCRRHRARLLARRAGGGPAAARNDALQTVDAEVVAFVDSDCRLRPASVLALLRYFADPAVGAVAPRVRPAPDEVGSPPAEGSPRRPLLRRYAAVRSALDMGPAEGPVGPGRAVRYVPSTALLVRRAAGRSGFDTRLRVGEDVDFVWRLADRGWDVRYVPGVVAQHREPDRWTRHLLRRFRYGTSAGPLARRHLDRMAPIELTAETAALLVAALRGRPLLAAAFWSAATGRSLRHVAGTPVPSRLAIAWQVAAPWWAVLGLARATTTVVLPGAAALLLAGSGRRWRWAVALLALPGLVEWWQRRPDVDPLRWSLACLADDLCYGAGVWVGCARSRTARPLVPSLRRGWLRRTTRRGVPLAPASR